MPFYHIVIINMIINMIIGTLFPLSSSVFFWIAIHINSIVLSLSFNKHFNLFCYWLQIKYIHGYPTNWSSIRWILELFSFTALSPMIKALRPYFSASWFECSSGKVWLFIMCIELATRLFQIFLVINVFINNYINSSFFI